MTEFFSAYPVIAWGLVSIMLALVVIATLWENVKWWWLNTWMTFPVIGRIARLAKDTNKDIRNPLWLKSETTLCDEYRKFISIQDEHDFLEKVRYLTRAGDNGRRPVPGFIWLLTIAMVFVEAMGFSYVLAGYTLPGASENLQQTGAYGIAFLISIILVALTHFAGHELYVSGKVSTARRQWQEGGRQGQLRDRIIPLAMPQSEDDGRPSHTQLLNRVSSDVPSYKITVLTAVFVIFVAIFATYVRGQVLEKSLHQEIVGLSAAPAGSGFDGLDMSMDSPLPAADMAQDRETMNKVAADEASIDRHGGWATFIVLAFVFVFLQILGVLFGYRWGFAGQDSAAAFRGIGSGRYSTYNDIRQHYEQIADNAQAKLADLQQKLMQHNAISGTRGIDTACSFYDYMAIKRHEQAGDRANQRVYTPKNNLAAAHVSHTATMPTSPSLVVETVTATPAPAPAHANKDADLVAIIEAMSSKEEKLAYIQSLPAETRQQVVVALKRAKEERDRMTAELDGLL